MNVILLEDDAALGSLLSQQLTQEGFAVSWCQSLAEASEALHSSTFEVALFDIMLPDGSALDLVRALRERLACPLLFISATNSAEQRLLGYELGAVEFIPKPFFFKELLLLIQRAVSPKRDYSTLDRGGVVIDKKAMSITFRDGSTRFPTAKDFLLLQMLVEAAPAVVSREEIVQKLSRKDTPPTPRVVDNAILRLRQIFESHGLDCIRSVRGIGYQWVQSDDTQQGVDSK